MKTAIIILMAMFLIAKVDYGEAIEEPPPIPAAEQPEVLTRGPVNEAFAQPINMEDQTGFVALTEPPDNIEEVPPADRPAGDQFVWIPGYWAWDSERNDYIWVSGCWRAAPPGMYWVPGYWTKISRGWRWVAGFWVPVSNKEIEYLPAPPELKDTVAPGPAPAPDRIWVQPCWYWSHERYILRPGYWLLARKDWIWVPSHYTWTPRGYVFVNGHWDYSLNRRGVLFAPVYLPKHIYYRPRFSYKLSIVVNIGNLEFGLFTRPQYSHYYFGDYYDKIYIKIGIFPWFECEQRHTWYDPIYVHNRWQNQKNEPRWEEHERREYNRRRADRSLRPSRTYREMEHIAGKMPRSQRDDFAIAAPITKVVKTRKTIFKFDQVKTENRQQISRHSNDVHRFAEERRHWESQGARKAGRPWIGSVPSKKSEEMAPMTNNEAPEMMRSKRREPSPSERSYRGSDSGRGMGKSNTYREQQRNPEGIMRIEKPDQSDKVKVRTPPVVGRQERGFFRKKAPSWPPEERNDLR